MADRTLIATLNGKEFPSELAINTVKIALERYKPSKGGLIIHSDQGSQYTSKEFTDFCLKNSITQSMSKAGCPYDNVPMERYFNTFKNELIYLFNFDNDEQLNSSVYDYAYVWYNHVSPHTFNKGLTPFETSLEEKIIEQNKQLNESIDEKQMLPDFYTNQYEEINSYSNGHTIDLGSVIMKWVKTITIDGRNVIISIYALYVLLNLIYLGIFGSRDLAKRKKGVVSLIGISLVFLLYINIPLIMMYIQGDKTLISQVSFTDRVNNIVLFLQRNSFIIATILAYVGVTKLIVSKNDLGFKLQGRYLVKFSFILLILLNIVPIIIWFIV